MNIFYYMFLHITQIHQNAGSIDEESRLRCTRSARNSSNGKLSKKKARRTLYFKYTH